MRNDLQRLMRLAGRIGLTLGLLIGAVSQSGLAGPIELGLQTPPLTYPTFSVSHSWAEGFRLELGLTHQRTAAREATRVGLLGEWRLAPVERDGLRLVPTVSTAIDVGRVRVGLPSARSTRSTTPMLALRLIVGAEHEADRLPVGLYVRAWHAVSLYPFGLGWGAAVGVRVPWSTISNHVEDCLPTARTATSEEADD